MSFMNDPCRDTRFGEPDTPTPAPVPTPRTDAAKCKMYICMTSVELEAVPADFARTLERELAQAQSELQRYSAEAGEKVRALKAAFRPVVEERDRLHEDHAAINAERAEARTIRDEMIRAQDENAQLRAALVEAEKALKDIGNILWGWDGDCGAERIADQALARIAAIKNGGAHA